MTPSPRSILCVVPAVLAQPADVDVLLRCLVSLWSSAQVAATLVVDHGEADPALVAQLSAASAELDFELDPRWAGASRTTAVNAGLQLALDNDCDALVLDPGVQLPATPWLDALRARTDRSGRPAAVVGGQLRNPNGTVHRAGFYFSRLTRAWNARLEHAPADLVQAGLPCRCPVPDAFMFVRLEALRAVGTYDESLCPPLDSIDFCLRVFAAGLECVYDPSASAVRDGREPAKAERSIVAAFDAKWHGTDLSPWVPPSL